PGAAAWPRLPEAGKRSPRGSRCTPLRAMGGIDRPRAQRENPPVATAYSRRDPPALASLPFAAPLPWRLADLPPSREATRSAPREADRSEPLREARDPEGDKANAAMERYAR